MDRRHARAVVVTGAGGFIGSHLVEALIGAGARVRALVRYNGRGDLGMLHELPPAALGEVEVVLGDVRDAFHVDRLVAGAEVVFHLAALIGIPYSYLSPADYVATNVQGTLDVLEACRRHGALLVHTSTSEVYGTARYVPIDEAHPLQPQSPYSASKVGADALVESYHRSFGLGTVTVRPFNTFGPRQSARAVVPMILSQLLAGEPVKLGALSPERDLCFVTDTVAGFLALGACPEAVGRVVNLGTGRAVSVGELALRSGAVTGREVEIQGDAERLRPPASEVERLQASSQLAESLCGWRARVELDDGLARTAEWIGRNLARFSAGRYAV